MVQGNITDPLVVSTGVLQGDVLAPFIFIILVDYLMKKATDEFDREIVTHPRRSSRHPAKHLNDLDFDDNIAVLESTTPLAQATRTAAAAKDLGLIISASKTEYMTYNLNPQPTLHVYSDTINHVSDFRYLRSMMASSKCDLKRRKALAWSAFWKLEHLWWGPALSITVKNEAM